MRFLSETKIDFLGARRFGFVISGALLLTGMISLFLQNGPKLGIDFTGGTRVMVKFDKSVEISSVRDALAIVEIEGETFDFSKAEIKLERDKELGDLVSVRLPKLPETVDDADEAVINKLINAFPESVPKNKIEFKLSTDTIGPKIGSELRGKAILAIISSILMILIYVSIRFQFKFAIGAIAALVHDVLITLGIFSIMDYEISLVIVAAFLTIVGYSLNDTIVVFDRVRENLKRLKQEKYETIINKSINESLSRTVITSLTTFMVVFILWLTGGEVIRYFAFAMMVGILIGTYSSMFVASPVVVAWHNRFGKSKSR
ncbi:MAG: protein translocase subunit SecF [Candidatus Marinimicrobia bacterium]|jgi:preprotein translocase SecF subunit|nr:protein translocase subunit SecF [Candidatus Neomarinimicrobiota bacterium]MDP7025756.1 protein translocase subunit SecF [Candidatus Neomarinimicrobiota bacterium]|tara:strand:- start:4887 stop:5837 length:951 start_codon:yes stop_codon:yes gene_type:complete